MLSLGRHPARGIFYIIIVTWRWVLLKFALSPCKNFPDAFQCGIEDGEVGLNLILSLLTGTRGRAAKRK